MLGAITSRTYGTLAEPVTGATYGHRRRREGLRKTTQMTIRRCRMLHFVATSRASANGLTAGNEAIPKRWRALVTSGSGTPMDRNDVGTALTGVAGAVVGLVALGRLFWLRLLLVDASRRTSGPLTSRCKLECVEASARAERTAMEVRLGERLDRMDARTEKMEARLLDASRGRREPPPGVRPPPDPLKPRRPVGEDSGGPKGKR